MNTPINSTDEETRLPPTPLRVVRTMRGKDVHVHAVGCRDLAKRGKYLREDPAWTTVLVPKGDVIPLHVCKWELADIASDTCSTDEEYDAYFSEHTHLFTVFPCAEKAHKGEA